jgi:hypothetical protein
VAAVTIVIVLLLLAALPTLGDLTCLFQTWSSGCVGFMSTLAPREGQGQLLPVCGCA